MSEMSRAVRLEAEHQRRQLVQKLPSTFSLRVSGKARMIKTKDVIESGFNRTRPGSDLWSLLRRRLRMLLTMRRDWGNIDDVYGHCESDFGQVDLPWYIRDPQSDFSSAWDLVQVAFLVYVSWSVPLRACFEVETEIFSLVWLIDSVVDVYFITDLFSNFVTAYYDQNGVREGRVEFIARRYLRGWFSIDFVSCIPVDYITMAMESSSDSEEGEKSNFRAFKVLRLFRLSKMLRLARIQRILQRYEDLEFVQNYAGMVSAQHPNRRLRAHFRCTASHAMNGFCLGYARWLGSAVSEGTLLLCCARTGRLAVCHHHHGTHSRMPLVYGRLGRRALPSRTADTRLG
jgi:hypothetical protein